MLDSRLFEAGYTRQDLNFKISSASYSDSSTPRHLKVTRGQKPWLSNSVVSDEGSAIFNSKVIQNAIGFIEHGWTDM